MGLYISTGDDVVDYRTVDLFICPLGNRVL